MGGIVQFTRTTSVSNSDPHKILFLGPDPHSKNESRSEVFNFYKKMSVFSRDFLKDEGM